jgi:hypothetical protein
MSLVQQAKYYRWIRQSLSRWQRSIEKYLLVFDAADVDADGPRVDPDHAGHWIRRTDNVECKMQNAKSPRKPQSSARCAFCIMHYAFCIT